MKSLREACTLGAAIITASRNAAPAYRHFIYASEDGWELYAEVRKRRGLKERSEDKILTFGTRRLLMLDFDKINLQQCTAVIESIYRRSRARHRFSLYKTANGYHAFCVSQPYGPRSYIALSWAAASHADSRYALMSAMQNRFDVRMSPKSPSQTPAAVHIGYIGTDAEDPCLRRTLDCHDSILEWAVLTLPDTWSLENQELWASASEYCRKQDGK